MAAEGGGEALQVDDCGRSLAAAVDLPHFWGERPHLGVYGGQVDAILKRTLHGAAVEHDAVSHKHEHAAAAGAHRGLKPCAAAVACHREAAQLRAATPRRHKHAEVALAEVLFERPEGDGEVGDGGVGGADEQRHVLAVVVDGVRGDEGGGGVAGGAEGESGGADYVVADVIATCGLARVSACVQAPPITNSQAQWHG